MRILVTGATGAIGSALVPRLISEGHDVVAATRHPESYAGAGEAVHFDVSDAQSVDAAIAKCDAVYYLVHSMESPDFEKEDRDAAERVAHAAAYHERRVIYLGGLGDDEVEHNSAHLRSRHQVGKILRDESDAVELRAAIVLGPRSASFEIMRQLVERLPIMVCPRWVTTRCQPIALDDVVTYLVGALSIPAGRYDIGGAEILTYEQMMRGYARIIGRRRLILKVPVLSPRLSSHWIGLITDQPAAVARPLAEGLSVEVIAEDHRIREFISLEPMGFDEAVRRTIAATS